MCIFSVTWCIIADIDYDSERHRWMGGFRFTFTAVQKILKKMKPYQGKISYRNINNAEEDDDGEIPCKHPCRICNKDANQKTDALTDEDNILHESMQEYSIQSGESSVVTLEDEFSVFILTNAATLSYDTKVAPHAHLADGYFNLIYAKKLSKPKMAQFLLGLEDGKFLKMKDIHHERVKSLIIEPKEGVIMLDGEKIPTTNILVQVHKGWIKLFRG
jgi:diacylglycerol kinase family enzyme